MKGPFEVGLEPKQNKNLGSVGGAGSSATPGGYNQGLQFAAEGGFTASQALSEINARPMGCASETGGKHSAKEASGYNQGTMFAGKTGK